MNSKEIEEKKNSRKIIISLIIIIILVFTVISISFTTYIKMEQKRGAAEDLKGNVSMTYTEDNNGISIENAVPISDEVGKSLSAPDEYFDFTVKTKVVKENPITYEIVAVKDKNSTLSDKDIRIYLQKQVSGTYEEVMSPTEFIPISKKTNIGAPQGVMVLQKITRKNSSSDNYRLRMWVSEKTLIQDIKTYAIRINVYGKIV